MGLLQYFLSTLNPSKDDGSYIELDTSMKKRLKTGGIISMVFFLLIVAFTLYFYFKWEPIRQLTDDLKSTIIDTINKTGDFPKWLIRVVSYMLVIAIILSLIFSYLLINLAKLHYRLDSITFRVIKKINLRLQEATLEHLACTNKAHCTINNKLKTQGFSQRFRDDFFYFFTDQDNIGSFNQKDKRRQVFAEWTKYYIFNFSFTALNLSFLWIGSLLIIKLSIPFLFALALYIGVLAILFFLYIRIGKQYRTKLIDLGIQQINVIFSEIPGQAITRLKSVFGSCFENSCKLN